MRGTGCSGGAFDYFEPLQALDGYDVVETVARQPWVAARQGRDGRHLLRRHQPALRRRRPGRRSLAAITPLSVIDNTQTTLYPGGILNTGFALEWAQDRVDDCQAGRPPTAASLGLASGSRTATRPARRTRSCTPRPSNLIDEDPPQPLLPAEGRRPARAGHVRRQDRRPGLPRLPVDRRADRRPLPDAGRALHRHEAQVVHVHQRGPHRLARPGDVQPLVRLPRALRRPAKAGARARRRRRRAPVDLPGRDGRRRRDAAATTRSRSSPTTSRRKAAFEALPPVRILFDNGAGGDARPARARASSARSSASRRRARSRAPGTSAGGGSARRQAAAGGRRPVHLGPGRAPADRLHRRHRLRRERPVDRHARATTGRQNPAGTALSYVTAPLGSDTAVLGAGALQRLGPLVGAERRPAGDGLRGPPRRQGDLRPERLAADQRAQARPRAQHAARAGAEPAQARRRPLPKGRLVQGHGAALLPGPRLPGGLADPGDVSRAGRRPADLGVRRDRAERHPLGRGRPLRERPSRLVLPVVPRLGARRRCRRARPCAASPAATTCRSSTRNSATAGAARRGRSPVDRANQGLTVHPQDRCSRGFED